MSFGHAIAATLMVLALPVAAQAEPSRGGANSLGGEAAILRALKARSAGQAQGARSQTGNFASITQVGDYNNSTIIQHGNANEATTSIRGSSNVTYQEQSGARNRSSINISNGDRNTIRTRQIGSENYVGLTFSNTDNLSIDYSQIGSGMNGTEQNIVIDSNAQTPMGIVIQQTKR